MFTMNIQRTKMMVLRYYVNTFGQILQKINIMLLLGALQLILAKYSLIEPLSVNDLNNLYEDIVSALRNCSDPYLRKWHKSIKFK